MLSQSDKEYVLREFPNVKLSYENITYKKVYNSDYIVAVPEGKKCFAWFTNLNDKMVCLIMELTDNKQIANIKIVNACFSNELAYGTILYGTMLYYLNNNFFYIEDIFSFKGDSVERVSWGEKLVKINDMLKNDLKQISYNKNFVVFGLPLMCRNNEEFENKIKNIKYNIETVKFMLFNRVNNCLIMTCKKYFENKVTYNKINKEEYNKIHKEECKQVNKEEYKQLNKEEYKQLNKEEYNKINKEEYKQLNKEEYNKINKERIIYNKTEIVFLVRPEIQNDIYYLHCLDDYSKEKQHSIAHIPDYNASVMMNKLFRIIKENNNLDALEESDDEEEFENDNVEKFVQLNKSYKMVCQFNHKFKKWCPIKLANENVKIITEEELKSVYKMHEQNRRR